jgi:hypothetical protein
MDAEKTEVFCENIQCGDPEVHTGGLVQHETRKYRRMNYMGSKEIKPVKVIANMLLSRPSLPKGQYHYYSCPVCGAERIFHEYKGLFTEIDKDKAKLVA